jgi:hypothetical protein
MHVLPLHLQTLRLPWPCMDSLVGSRASASCVLKCSSSATPRLLSQSHPSCCLACLVLQAWSVIMRFPFHAHISYPPGNFLIMLLPTFLAHRAPVSIPHFPPFSALVLCDSDDEVLILCSTLFVSSPLRVPFFRPCPIPLFALDLSRWLTAVADALLGMVNIELLLLLLLPCLKRRGQCQF